VQSQTATFRRIECLPGTLAAGAVANLVFPVSVLPGAGARTTLTVSASAQTTTPELVVDNNRAWKEVIVRATAAAVSRNAQKARQAERKPARMPLERGPARR
jgi:hypothetical protein